MGAETAMKFLREYDYVKFGMSADWALGRYKKVCDTRTSKPDEWTFWSKLGHDGKYHICLRKDGKFTRSCAYDNEPDLSSITARAVLIEKLKAVV